MHDAELGVAAAADGEDGRARGRARGGPQAAAPALGDGEDGEDDVALARGLEREGRGAPLVQARVVGPARGEETRVVPGSAGEVHAAGRAELAEVGRDQVLERAHGEPGRGGGSAGADAQRKCQRARRKRDR